MSEESKPGALAGLLAGGSSRRFGSDKARASLAGRAMAQWPADALREVVDSVVLLGGDDELARLLGMARLPDRFPGAGPLAGLAEGLRRSRSEGRWGLLVLACDLPLVPPVLLQTLLDARRSGIDAVVPETENPPGVQPLCGWYGPGAETVVLDRLREGSRSMVGLLDELRVIRIDAATGRRPVDPAVAFRNVNTREELEEVEGLLRDQDRPELLPGFS